MLDSVITFYRETRRSGLLAVLFLATMGLGTLIPSYGQTVFNCSIFNSGNGTCGSSGPFKVIGGLGSITGSNQLQLAPAGTSHAALAANYTTPVNVQAFTATYTFVPSGNVLAFVLQNTNNQSGYQGTSFVAGAGCEGGFFQASNAGVGGQSPNNVFAITMDGYNNLSPTMYGPGPNGFTYSGTALYRAGQDPCKPNDGDPVYNPVDNISTSPVSLNSPASTPNTTTRDTYSVTITYDGSNVTENLFDVTAGGSCPGASCFTHTWTGINIPSIVGGSNTALVGITASTISAGNAGPVLINSWSYTEGSTQNAAAAPTFSPPAGTYTSAQTVTIFDATSGATIYYTTNGTTPTTSSAVYAGPITVSSSETIEAIAVKSGYADSAVASAAYAITPLPPPPTVSTPTFTPPAGTYTSAQTVTILDSTSGATIYYTTNGTTPTTSSAVYAGPITVSSSETIEAIAVKSGDTNSAVASAAYTITPPPTVSTPTFTPPAGTYTSAQTVTILDSTSGATIYYTTNGTTPTTSSAVYAGPITVSSSETIEAIAVKSGDTNSAVASAAYTITPPPTVSTPTFTPPAGTYNSAQSVTISDATSGATIYYTTNGTTPTTSSAVYAGPITVSSSETIEAIAVKSGDTNSAVASAAYTITPPPTVSTPTFTPPAGTYNSAQSVTISDATSGAAIYYTTNGTTPTTSSAVYAGPITVSSSETIEAIAVKSGDTNSAVASAAYTITPPPTVSTPTFTPPAGTYNSAQSVTISDATSGAAIYYTTNGTTPTTSSAVYAGPITVSSSETIEAIAVKSGDTNSAVASAAYTITPPPTVSTPTFTPPAGTYNSAQSVTISDATSGATIYYTTDGTTPTTSSTLYTGPITINTTGTLEAIAAVAEDSKSAVASAAYTISPPTTVSTPTFTPPEGAYTSAQSVTISDATSGATIYYTTDGTTPTTSSTLYTGPITVSATEMLEAIATVTEDTTSAVASAAYTITPLAPPPTVSTPTFTPPAGAYTSAQSVTISDATSGAIIYFTIDGTTPTTSSTLYSGPITVSATEMLEAIATVTEDTTSAVASAAYTITPLAPPPTVSTPTFTPPAGAYTSAQSVTISDATSGAIIYFTIDGTTPTTSSTLYTGPITISATGTLEAIAAVMGGNSSAVASAAYTVPLHPDFVLSASLPSLTVSSGGQAALMLTVTPENGFDSPVALACSGLPSGTTCSFSQETVIPAGQATTTQLTISASTRWSAFHRESPPFSPLTLVAMTACFFGRKRWRSAAHWLLAAVAYSSLGLLFGCGGGVIKGSLTTPTPFASTVTVMATSGTLRQNVTIALTVK